MSEIRVNKVINEAGTGSVELTQGATLPSGKTLSGAGSLNITGISTFGGDVSIGGTLTYQDVTNIDSVGLITARAGINVTGGNTTIKGAVETVATGSHCWNYFNLRYCNCHSLHARSSIWSSWNRFNHKLPCNFCIIPYSHSDPETE